MKRLILTAGFAALVACATQEPARAAWELSCEDDPIEDTRVCNLAGTHITVIGLAKRDGRLSEFVTLGYDRYPGSDKVFRVDQNAAIRWPENETTGDSARLIEQMIKGKKMLTRYTKWPYGTTVDGTESLSGFAAKLQEMRQRLRQYAVD